MTVLRDPRIAKLVPSDHVAVQCTYFEKSAKNNWLVPVHQDLSIPVAAYVDDPSLSGWSRKEDMLFVHAPTNLLPQLIAIRIHLDDCKHSDGPLEVVPGSHSLGRISPTEAARSKKMSGAVACLLDRGDALVLRPLLLHASSKATGSSRRRVLHFLLGPRNLPNGLAWGRAV